MRRPKAAVRDASASQTPTRLARARVRTDERKPALATNLTTLETRKIKRHTRLAFGVSGSRCDGFPEAPAKGDGMGRGSGAGYRARRLERERERRQRQEGATMSPPPRVRSAQSPGNLKATRAVAVPCAWCGGRITPGARGPIPKWCSATCRHRAWEQTRAAVSGRSAVEVLERRIEIPVALVPTRRDWPRVLAALAAQVEDGRLYDRDLAPLATAMAAALAALRRRISLLP